MLAFILKLCIFVNKNKYKSIRMVYKKDISFEEPDSSGVKLCLRNILTYVGLAYLTSVLLFLIFNKQTIYDLCKDFSCVHVLFLGISTLVTMVGLVHAYRNIIKTRKFYIPWDTIQFAWTAIVLLLFLITCF